MHANGVVIKLAIICYTFITIYSCGCYSLITVVWIPIMKGLHYRCCNYIMVGVLQLYIHAYSLLNTLDYARYRKYGYTYC